MMRLRTSPILLVGWFLVAAAVVLGLVLSGGPQAQADPPVRGGDGPQGADRSAPESVPGEVLVRFQAGTSLAQIAEAVGAAGGSVADVDERSGLVELSVPDAGIDVALDSLLAEPAVAEAGPNFVAEALEAPKDPEYKAQWNLHDAAGGIFVESAWDLAPERGAGVTVAVIDTGVAYEKFADPAGRSFSPSPDLAAGSFVSPWDFIDDDSHANDEHGHGTHVAGTIASGTGNGVSVAGIASGAAIMPLKVLGSDGRGTAADVVEAIHHAIDNGANIINLSLAFPASGSPDQEGAYCTQIVGLNEALEAAVAAGVTVVAAAGNDSGQVLCPAAADSTIAVGATRFDESLAYYSSGGANLDVVAPGGDDRVDQNGDGRVDGILQSTYCSDPAALATAGAYDKFCDVYSVGTSMAAAHVAGVIALALGEEPSLDPGATFKLVTSTARDLGPESWDAAHGWGLLDAGAALDLIAGGGPIPTPPPRDEPPPSEDPPPTETRSYPPNVASLDLPFARVIDGNKIEFWNGSIWGVRYIGVDAPAGNTPCGRDAIARHWQLVGGIHLELEPPYDVDDELLRLYHGFTPDGQLIGEILIGEGLARTSDEPHQYRDRYLAAEADARAAGRGCFWSGEAAALEPAALPASDEGAPEVPAEIAAATLPAGFEEELVTGGLIEPTAFEFLPDGRMLIAEKRGVVRMFKDGALLGTPFIDIQDRVNPFWDHGLIGLTVDPDFATNGWVYLSYTYENDAGDFTGRKTARLTRVTAVGDFASPTSEVVLVGTVVGQSCNDFPVGTDCIPSDSPSHSIGQVRFANDGEHLFLNTGDGASFNVVDDDALRAQNLDRLSGKVLFINRDGTGVTTNPFYDGNANSNRSKVWARGVRNAFRFNVRPSTGIPYLGDVGWDTVEEIDVVLSAANLGWPCYEGTPRQPGYEPKPICQALYALGPGAVTAPLYEWDHSLPGGAAAVGGDFATSYPAPYADAFFFGDFSQSWIKYLTVDDNENLIAVQDFATDADNPVQLQTGPDGEIYYVAIGVGEIRHIKSAAGNRNPIALAGAVPTSGLAPLDVQFTGDQSSDPDFDPLTHVWDFGDGSPTSTAPSPAHTYVADGVYAATLTVDDGQGGQDTDTVVITVGNRAPTVTITSPLATTPFRTGDLIAYSATANDLDEGPIAASSLEWTITLHHCLLGACHVHPFLTGLGDDTFVIPEHGDELRFEFVATATDSGGLQGSDQLFIDPEELLLTFETSPPGLSIVYAGSIIETPVTITSIPNSVRTISAPSPQLQGALEATFVSWSDGGAQQHDIFTGTEDQTITANFTTAILSAISFDDLDGQNQVLSGVYPIGTIDWGTDGTWWHSEPFGGFTTKSVTFNGPGINSGTMTLIQPRRFASVEAYNGSGALNQVTLSCPGQPDVVTILAGDSLTTIETGWAGTCTSVTIESANGWDTNFDDILLSEGAPDTTPPAISAVAEQNVTATSADIVWTTNEPATSQVEWGLDPSYGNFTALDSALVTAHSQALAGLSPDTEYHYRVLSEDGSVNSAVSGDNTFTTGPADTTAPVISAVAEQNVSDVGAEIVWATDEPATTRVEWGTDTSYGNVTALDAALVSAHSQALTGLSPDTEYHYRVLSEDGSANASVSGDNLFTTASSPPSTVTVTFDELPGVNQVLGGEYPVGLIDWGTDGTWWHSEPWGPFTTKSVTFNGAGINSGTIALVTPRRLESVDVFNGFAPATVTLSCPGQADVVTPLAAGGQATIVTGWAGTCTSITLASTEGWDTNFDNLVLISGAPDATPPVISAVAEQNVTATSADIVWTTNEEATSQVEWGLDSSYGNLTALDPALVTAHSQALAGLSPDTEYHYRVLSEDGSGNAATSGDSTFTTAPDDTTAPVISAVAEQNVTATSADVVWTTDEPATTQIEWGTDTSYGNFTALDAALVSAHSQALTGLSPDTEYHYRVLSEDGSANASVSGDNLFTTASPPPSTVTVTFDDLPGVNQVLSGEYPVGVIDWGTDGTWWHSEPWGPFTTKSVTFNGAGITSGTIALVTPRRLESVDVFNGFAPATVTLSCPGQTDVAVNLVSGGLTTIVTGWAGTCTSITLASTEGWDTNFDNLVLISGAPDATAPVISAVAEQNVTATSADVVWTTNEGATTQVEWGTDTSYGSLTALDPALVTAHSQALAGLSPDTEYHYRVHSEDGSGNAAASGDNTFTTGPADTTAPVISAVVEQNVTATSADVVWTTDEPATTRVEWGTDTSYGNFTTLDAALVTAHSQGLTGLSPETEYHYRVLSEDGSGNASVSGDNLFTTSAVPAETLTVTFDDLPGVNQVLSGEYPAGVIDWGTDGAWWHSEPWGPFTTKSVTFNGAGITSGTFALVTPRRLESVDVFNGFARATVTLSCPGQTDVVVNLASGGLTTIVTGWAGTCTSITLASTEGWDTNFDNLVLVTGG